MKDQLYRISRSEFTNGYSGLKSFRDLRETGPGALTRTLAKTSSQDVEPGLDNISLSRHFQLLLSLKCNKSFSFRPSEYIHLGEVPIKKQVSSNSN